jgi:MFS family permease
LYGRASGALFRWAQSRSCGWPALPQIWILVVALLLFGAFSVFGFAATQSLLPRLVPRARLVSANARLDQTDAAAQTLGPAIGGGLVGLLGAPVAITVDAISYLIDAALNAGIRVDEPRPDSRNRDLRAEIRDGLRWTYADRTLGPLAVSAHVWFLANGAATTVLSKTALRPRRLLLPKGCISGWRSDLSGLPTPPRRRSG